jgi:hypothetical protein
MRINMLSHPATCLVEAIELLEESARIYTATQYRERRETLLDMLAERYESLGFSWPIAYTLACGA